MRIFGLLFSHFSADIIKHDIIRNRFEASLYSTDNKTRSGTIALLRVLLSCLLFTSISYRCGHLKPPQQFRKFSFVCAASCGARKTSLRHPCLSEVSFRMRRIRAAPGKLTYDIRVFRKFSFICAASVQRPENFLTTSVSYGTALLLFLRRVLFVGCTGLLFIFCFLFKALVDIIYILH